MFAVLHSDINSLNSGLLHLTSQLHCKKGRSAKVKDRIINLILRSYLIDQYKHRTCQQLQLYVIGSLGRETASMGHVICCYANQGAKVTAVDSVNYGISLGVSSRSFSLPCCEYWMHSKVTLTNVGCFQSLFYRDFAKKSQQRLFLKSSKTLEYQSVVSQCVCHWHSKNSIRNTVF